MSPAVSSLWNLTFSSSKTSPRLSSEDFFIASFPITSSEKKTFLFNTDSTVLTILLREYSG